MSRRLMRVILAVVIVAVTANAVTACRTAETTDPPDAATRSEDDLIRQFGGPRLLSPIPAITLEPVGVADGAAAPAAVTMPSPSGHAMVVVFVSADCATCLRDTRFWLALRREAAQRNAVFLLASVERNREKVETFARTLQAAHAGLKDLPVFYSATVGPTLRIGFVPFYMLIDKEGRMRSRSAGVTPEGTTDDERAAHFLQPLDSARPHANF